MLDKRLKDILNSKNLTVSQFAEMCDLPFETVKNIYYGRTADPQLHTVLKMSEVLGISVNSLAGQSTLSPEEELLLGYYRLCGSHGKNTIVLTAKTECYAAKYERECMKRRKIPCIVPSGSIRDGIEKSQYSRIEIETSNSEAHMSIKITSNDFVPTYCKNDIVLIANRFPNNGEYGLFQIEDKTYFRMFLETTDGYILKALHNYGEDIFLKRLNKLEYLGTCIGVVIE